jgi:hypothetical protein
MNSIPEHFSSNRQVVVHNKIGRSADVVESQYCSVLLNCGLSKLRTVRTVEKFMDSPVGMLLVERSGEGEESFPSADQ